jgi:hypothetical protein
VLTAAGSWERRLSQPTRQRPLLFRAEIPALGATCPASEAAEGVGVAAVIPTTQRRLPSPLPSCNSSASLLAQIWWREQEQPPRLGQRSCAWWLALCRPHPPRADRPPHLSHVLTARRPPPSTLTQPPNLSRILPALLPPTSAPAWPSGRCLDLRRRHVWPRHLR